MVRVEYEVNGVHTMSYGEISEAKLEQFFSSGENFIGIVNNSDLTWVAKDSIVRVSELKFEDIRYERSQIYGPITPEDVRCFEY